jgi:hypothetical protein
MYCQGTEKLTLITLNDNETYTEALKKKGIQWSYEILNDISIFENKRAITVRVYLANEIRTGRYVYTENEAHKAHYLAVEDALSQLSIFVPSYINKTQEKPNTTSETVSTPITPVEPTQQTTQPLTQEEILDMIMQQQNTSTTQSDTLTNTPITTAEQLNNDTRSEIPFNDLQLPEDELDKMLSGNVQSPTEEVVLVPTQSQQVPTNFTQEQIQRINNFKQKFNVKNDEEFGKYVNSWDKKYSSKRDITPANIESFLKHVESLGEFPG